MTMKSGKREFIIALLRGLVYAAAVFTLIMAVLLIANYIQVSLHDPLDNPALSHLNERLEKDPGNQELREEIRALDLLVRKAYFTSLWQVRTGMLLLLAGTILLILSAKGLAAVTGKVPAPPGVVRPESFWSERALSRNGIAGAAVVLVIAALFAGWGTRRSMDRFSKKEIKPLQQKVPDKNVWPSFRGPGGNGIAAAVNVPQHWDGATMQGVTWKVQPPLAGNSSPVIGGGRVFCTGGDRKKRVLCTYALKTGKLLWQREIAFASNTIIKKVKVDKETGYAAPTPVIDGKRVAAVFPTGELVCYGVNGKLLWKRQLDPPENHYGHSSSLITFDNLLFVQLDEYDNGELLALSMSNGKTIWKAERKQLSWSSPVCVNTGKRQELILTDNLDVVSYEPYSGRVLWRLECLYGEVGPSAAYAAGRVFVAGETASATCITLSDSAEGDTASAAWTWNDNLPSTASPVATERFVFFATAEGIVSCVDAVEGTTVWEQEFENGFYASPVIAEGRVYCTDRKGVTQIFAVDTAYRSIAAPPLGEDAVATPALIDGKIIIRGKKHLFCIAGNND